LGEPEGREGQAGPLETSPLPEGAAKPEGSAADPAQRVGVPPFRGSATSAGSLDVLVSLDEPEQLIRELKAIAESYPKSDERWEGVRRLCERAEEYFAHINQPKANRPTP
jgi:hypothetical protein